MATKNLETQRAANRELEVSVRTDGTGRLLKGEGEGQKQHRVSCRFGGKVRCNIGLVVCVSVRGRISLVIWC